MQENLFLIDGIACALLSAAATVKARECGAHITGSITLGCLCGLIGPMLREVFLHGESGASRIISQFPAEALIGALAGIFLVHLLRQRRNSVFFWTDSLGMTMAASIGSILGIVELGLTGAISLGLINGLAPGLIRDISLGDTAMLLDKSWYATITALACIVSLAVLLGIIALPVLAGIEAQAEIYAIACGVVISVALRYWKGR